MVAHVKQGCLRRFSFFLRYIKADPLLHPLRTPNTYIPLAYSMHSINVSVDLDLEDGEIAFTARGSARRKDTVKVSFLSVFESLDDVKRDIRKQVAAHCPGTGVEFFLSERAWLHASELQLPLTASACSYLLTVKV
jgi:hypothetical protein